MGLPQYVASNASPVVEPEFMEAAPTGIVMPGNMEPPPYAVNTSGNMEPSPYAVDRPGNMEPSPYTVDMPGYIEAPPDTVNMPEHNGAPPPMVVMPKYPQAPPVMVSTQPQPSMITVPPPTVYKTYMAWSILNLLFCSLSLGSMALNHSSKTRAAIHHQDSVVASSHSKSAFKWNVAATVFGTCLNIGLIVYLIYYVL